MVFGHDPAFSEFANYMVSEFDVMLPKCSVVGYSANRKKWKTLKAGDGVLEFYDSPNGIKQRRKHDKKGKAA
jgi:hypothetical protein